MIKMNHAIEVTRQACDRVPGAWRYLKNREDTPFMFSTEPIVLMIYEECDKIDPIHSGCSFALCMRQMEYLAKHR
jgi:hypothetical protein